MACTVYLLAFSALLVWLYFLWSRRRYYRAAWQLPGPIGWPFIGCGLKMMNPETFLQNLDMESRYYSSPFISWMGTNCFLYVNDPETVETIFNSPHCTNKGDFYRFVSSAIGDGLFTSSSPRWNRHRRLINPAFSRQVINNFLPIFNAEADVLLHKLAQSADDGTSVEIYEMLKKSVLEAACQTTMGKKMNFQNDGSTAIFESYNGMTEVLVKRMLSPWFYPDFIYHRSELFKKQQKFVSVVFGFVENLLQYGKKSSVMESIASMDPPTAGNGALPAMNDNASEAEWESGVRKSKAIFVEQVRNHIENGQLTWNDVRDEANVTIAATFETTSTALYLVCLCLAMHPEYQDKLYSELVELFPDNENNNISNTPGVSNAKSTVGDNCTCNSPTGTTNEPSIDANGSSTPWVFCECQCECQCRCHHIRVTSEQLERMTYTEMVINEAMRLFAPVPMVLRSASADFPLRNGVIIPRGTQIGIDIYNMQRNERIWGPYASQFRPELHFGQSTVSQSESQSESKSKSTTTPQPHPFAFVPFTKGLRMCIGYRYALMLMKVVLAKIFRNFRLHTDAKIEDLIIKGTISLKLREYPLCTVVRR